MQNSSNKNEIDFSNYPAILACWNSEEGQREFAAWQVEQAHHAPSKEKQSVPDCWVSVKQFSRIDTATACQDWLRVPGQAEETSSPMSAPSRCWHGTFCISGCCTPLARCNTLDFVPKSCAKVLRPFGIPAHIACGRMWFRRTESSHKGAPRLSAARRRRFCGSVITHYDTFIPAVCKV